MLTLDETTLFFHYRRTTAPAEADHKLTGVIKSWAKLVGSATNSSKTSRASSIQSAPTTLQNSTTETSGRITIGAAENDADEELEQREENTIGGFADEFEVDDFEADAARSSPIKGGKRVTSDVSFSPHFTHALIILSIESRESRACRRKLSHRALIQWKPETISRWRPPEGLHGLPPLPKTISPYCILVCSVSDQPMEPEQRGW
jgi:hypothetical protein